MSIRLSHRLFRTCLSTLVLMSFLPAMGGCDSEAEKAEAAERKKAGAELRRKAGLSIDEHEAACAKDDADSCAALATAYQVGEDKESNPVKAQEFFEKACTLGNGPSCIDAADTYLDKGEVAKARPLLDSGCKAEHDDCCTRLVSLDQADKKAAGDAADASGDAAAGTESGKEMTEAERLMAEIEAAEEDGG
jgi:TPR repeat protein